MATDGKLLHIHNFYLYIKSCYHMAMYGIYDQVCIQYAHFKCILGVKSSLRSVLRYAHAKYS